MQFGYENKGKGCSQKEDSKTASPSQTQVKTLFWVKWSKKPGWPAANWKKSFPGAITLATTQFLGKQTKICFLCYIADSNVFFSNKTAKALFLWYITQGTPVLLLTKQNILWVLWGLKPEHVTMRGTSKAGFTSVMEGLWLFEVTPTNPFYTGHGFRL